MPLTSGNFHALDADRMVVCFVMMNDRIKVNCAVSTDAMDQLEGAKRVSLSQREEQFTRLRCQIEKLAEKKFLNAEFEGEPPGIILRSIDFRQKS